MGAFGGLRIFGFPLHVRPGFALLLVLVVAVNGGALGVWLALAIAGFTILHELGHAFAARATGARAEISLDFLAGYASFEPTRELKRWERAGISFAGPAVQIVAGAAILAAMGVNPLERDDITGSDAALAVWWAGPMIGLFNLIPIVPLDGGGIVGAGLDRLMPGRAHAAMLYGSIAVTIAGAVALYTDRDLRPLATFLVFPLLMQLQMLSATRPSSQSGGPVATHQATAAAESAAWAGSRELPPPGVELSPWVQAHRALDAGDPGHAQRILVGAFSHRRPPTWLPPDAAPHAALGELVDLLPRPLPTGSPYAELVLAGVLARLGRFEEAAHYAAEVHSRHPSAGAALIVARCAAALDDTDLAMRWLEVAAATSTQPGWLAHAIDSAHEFGPMRQSGALQRLREQLLST